MIRCMPSKQVLSKNSSTARPVFNATHAARINAIDTDNDE